ncbi:DUF1853 family protein [Croceiramulus getboli]|nr:DUF1853 family protein [Flavobacteriaceae bacterium YJPT1-3]
MLLLPAYLQTPLLWKEEQFGVQQFVLPQLAEKISTTAEAPEGIRLGQRLEYCFKALIEAHPDFELVVHGLQIKRQKKTLGEIDFIVRDKRLDHSAEHAHKVYHVEHTFKFYCIDPNITEPIHRLVGPNRKDMFFTKLDKIKNHQLPLIYTEESKNALQHYGLESQAIQNRVYFKAHLFTPWNQEQKRPVPSAPLIRPLNAACTQGYWLRMEQLEDPFLKMPNFTFPTKMIGHLILLRNYSGWITGLCSRKYIYDI